MTKSLWASSDTSRQQRSTARAQHNTFDFKKEHLIFLQWKIYKLYNRMEIKSKTKSFAPREIIKTSSMSKSDLIKVQMFLVEFRHEKLFK